MVAIAKPVQAHADQCHSCTLRVVLLQLPDGRNQEIVALKHQNEERALCGETKRARFVARASCSLITTKERARDTLNKAI